MNYGKTLGIQIDNSLIPCTNSNPLSAILNCADLCTANHEAMASLLDQVSQNLHEQGDAQRLLEELRIEVSLRRPPFVQVLLLKTISSAAR